MTRGTSSFLSEYLPYILRRADQTLSGPFYSVLATHGVGRSEWRVLAVLHDLGELSVADLSEAALSPQPTVTHTLRRLEQRGYVSRSRGTADRRQRFVSITAAGMDLTETLIGEAERLSDEALRDASGLGSLVAQLRDLTAHVEANIADHKTENAQAG